MNNNIYLIAALKEKSKKELSSNFSTRMMEKVYKSEKQIQRRTNLLQWIMISFTAITSIVATTLFFLPKWQFHFSINFKVLQPFIPFILCASIALFLLFLFDYFILQKHIKKFE